MAEPRGDRTTPSPGYRLIRRGVACQAGIGRSELPRLRLGESPGRSFRAGQAERALIAGVGKPAALALLLVPAAAGAVDAWLIRGWAAANWLSDGAEPVLDPFE
jgi:hypothetical protein